MLEVIGGIFVLWIGFSILKGFLKAFSSARSSEFGKEARRIAVGDLGVPSQYYNFFVTNHMNEVKEAAQFLPQHDTKFKNTSWPRLIALTIYGEFHKDCEQFRYGNPTTEQLFQRLQVKNEAVANELARNPTEVAYKNA
jgi:hypothetical protein